MKNAQLLMIKGALSEESKETQDKVNECVRQIKEIVQASPAEGMCALAIVALEMGAEIES